MPSLRRTEGLRDMQVDMPGVTQIQEEVMVGDRSGSVPKSMLSRLWPKRGSHRGCRVQTGGHQCLHMKETVLGEDPEEYLEGHRDRWREGCECPWGGSVGFGQRALAGDVAPGASGGEHRALVSPD